MPPRYYFDHAATTPPLPEVQEATLRILSQGWGNPSSAHGEGRRARAAINQARAQVASFCGV
ncbi:MAG: aminotransferase class V-fold PLP-dependent enzyme, partial [Bdellovibrionota bacterium]